MQESSKEKIDWTFNAWAKSSLETCLSSSFAFCCPWIPHSCSEGNLFKLLSSSLSSLWISILSLKTGTWQPEQWLSLEQSANLHCILLMQFFILLKFWLSPNWQDSFRRHKESSLKHHLYVPGIIVKKMWCGSCHYLSPHFYQILAQNNRASKVKWCSIHDLLLDNVTYLSNNFQNSHPWLKKWNHLLTSFKERMHIIWSLHK
jgi:hypothetical protein